MVKKISVIGGSGFIGTRFVKRLIESGKQVSIIDKVESIFYPELWQKADVRDLESLLKTLEGSDVAINLAAEHRDNVTPKSLYDEVNVGGAENVCKACSELGIDKMIFTSSVAVYGFAPIRTDESGKLNPFNDYGRTKMLAEQVYREWLKENKNRSLVIVRPTVVFGERNRGNVYNLLKQIASGHFRMVGNGKNIKSMAYVENVAAFLEYSLNIGVGEHLFNYIDKPDLDMNTLVSEVELILGKKDRIGMRIPYFIGYMGGLVFDLLSLLTGKKYVISSIRVKKFCANTMFNAENIKKTDFKPPVSLLEGLEKTIKYEFLENHNEHLFYSE